MKNQQRINELYDAFLSLRNREEAADFMFDLMTKAEIEELANRWRAAKMLEENLSYKKIEEETGLSSRTIARVSGYLNSGYGGYKLMINRLKNNHHHGKPSLSKKELSG